MQNINEVTYKNLVKSIYLAIDGFENKYPNKKIDTQNHVGNILTLVKYASSGGELRENLQAYAKNTLPARWRVFKDIQWLKRSLQAILNKYPENLLLKSEISAYKSEIVEKENLIKMLTVQIENANSDRGILMNDLEKFKKMANLSQADLVEALELKEAKNLQLESKSKDLFASCTQLTQQRQELADQNGQLKVNLKLAVEENSSLASSLRLLQENHGILQANNKILQKELDALKLINQNLEVDRECSNKKCKILEENYQKTPIKNQKQLDCFSEELQSRIIAMVEQRYFNKQTGTGEDLSTHVNSIRFFGDKL